MKLLNCLECHTIVSINPSGVYCKCGDCRAKYLDDHLTVEYYGYSVRILGINNSEYKESLELPKEKYKTTDFNWFVIGENIRKVD